MKKKIIPTWLWNELELGYFNITKNDTEKTYKELEKQFNSIPSENDVIWRIFNNLIATSNDLNLTGRIYRNMAKLVEIEGKNHSEYLELAHEIELKNLQSIGVKEVEVQNKYDWSEELIRTMICSQGKSLMGKKYPIEYALEKRPIPTNCEIGSKCICRYKASDKDFIRRYEEQPFEDF